MSDEYDQGNIDSIKQLLQGRFGEVVDSFVLNTRKYVEGIAQGIDKQDNKIIENNAHPLKSSSGMMGMVRLQILAEDIENRSIEGIKNFSEDSEVWQLYLDLCAAMDRGIQKLEDEQKTLEGT